ncbi:MAG: hypothetical protein WCK98_02685 [bacterium]
MAQKSFSKLSTRNQSTLVSQIYKLINYYSSVFPTRERIYIKKLSKDDGNIYWVEDTEKELIATAIVDPNHSFNVAGVNLLTFGHTISKRLGQMERILNHIFTDYDDKSVALLAKPFVAQSIGFSDFGLVEFKPHELTDLWPEFAGMKTDYFNVHGESLVSALGRKEHSLFVKLTPKDLEKVINNNSALKDKFHQKVS